jgi:hypothetical protein
MDMVQSGLGWAELPWSVVAEKLKSRDILRLHYSFQQTDILDGVDVIWTEQKVMVLQSISVTLNLFRPT